MTINTDTSYHGPVVALDLDDTIYKERDFAISGYRAIDTLFADDVLPAMTRALLNGGNPLDAALEASGQPNPPTIPQMLRQYRYHTPHITPSPGAIEFLTTLQKQKIHTALITDGRSVTQRNKIAALGIQQFFSPEMIIISEEIGADKTSPIPFRQLVRLRPEASRFFYIADNPAKDFLYPNLLGWTTIQLRISPELNIHQPDTAPSPDHAPQIRLPDFKSILPVIIHYTQRQ